MNRSLSNLLSIIKKTISYLLYYTGITQYLIKLKLSNKIVILTYHRVLPYKKRNHSFSHKAIMVDPINFEMHLEVLSKYFTLIYSNDLEQITQNTKAVDKPICIITFDDGWYDNYVYAYPILKKYECPSIIFIPTDYISTKSTFWQERLGYMIWKTIKLNNDKSDYLLSKHGLKSIINLNEVQQKENIREYVRQLKKFPYDKINEIQNEFNEVIDKNDQSNIDRHLSWEQIKELNNNGVEIGSHACSHKILTLLPREDVEKELTVSKSIIENRLNCAIRSIAYPNGDYNADLGNITKKTGYKYGYGTIFGHNDFNSNMYNLKRVNINDLIADSKPVFLSTILGII